MLSYFRTAFADAKNYLRPQMAQVAALCHRRSARGVEVLLITSSNGRWIFPKGWPMDNKTDAEAAMIEAWEEAGVKDGSVSDTPIHYYTSNKNFDNGTSIACRTAVFAIDVSGTEKIYPEANKRDRKWVPLEQAKEIVEEDGMRSALQRL